MDLKISRKICRTRCQTLYVTFCADAEAKSVIQPYHHLVLGNWFHGNLFKGTNHHTCTFLPFFRSNHDLILLESSNIRLNLQIKTDMYTSDNHAFYLLFNTIWHSSRELFVNVEHTKNKQVDSIFIATISISPLHLLRRLSLTSLSRVSSTRVFPINIIRD